MFQKNIFLMKGCISRLVLKKEIEENREIACKLQMLVKGNFNLHSPFGVFQSYKVV